MEAVVIILVAAVVVAGAAIAWYFEHQRTAELRALAGEMGLSFDRGRDSSADERFARFAMFKRGHSRSARNIMRGEVELAGHHVNIELGDFRYTVGSGKDKKVRKFSYLVAVNPIGDCPETIVRREGLFDRVKGLLGFDDIDFESDEFSRKFHVSSDDKRFAYDLISQEMMEFMLQDPPSAMELEGELVCMADGSRRWNAQDFRASIRWLGGMLEKWPRHLVDSMASRPRS